MKKEYIAKIAECYKKGISVAGTTSHLYHCGFEGLKYMELRKIVIKERQRIDSAKNSL